MEWPAWLKCNETALESKEDYIEAPNLLFKINLHFT